ncbi:universal stress protein [Arthrobacter pigmenti]
MSGTIVVGYLPSEIGELALREALERATVWGARLVVVNSSRADTPVDPLLATDEDLKMVRKVLEQAGVDHHIENPVRGRDAADEILDAAEAHDARLIVMGLRPRSRVGKILFGSTAQRILLQAKCPVLSVKIPERD